MSIRAPKGTYDILPPNGEAVLAVREALAAPVRAAGYRYIETPTFEETSLFVRGVGASTDVVSKEMYSFTTRGDDDVTLRPEGTASVVRAALQHGLATGPLPIKLWYSGSFYRYERPQAGRYRHFAQVGAEALGSDDPAIDAELIAASADAYAGLGLTGVRVLLNSLGDAADRPRYRQRLMEFLDGLDLDEATRQRATVNPLRVLDDKRPQVQEQLTDAPLLIDSIGSAAREHYDAVRGYLSDLGIVWEESPRLVRGLDYYSRTTFEFVHDGLGAQSAVGGGGRYDGLSESIGGPALPSVGFALGVDRTLLALEAEGVAAPGTGELVVFGVSLGEAAHREVLRQITALRRAGIPADLAPSGRGLKGAMKAADRSGATWAIIVGERDLAAGEVQLKRLATGEQTTVPLDVIVARVQEELS